MGVYVLGMHRSGTSAVTRALSLLGVSIGEPRMPPQPDNPAGFWEVTTLADLNDELLDRLGGSWDAPPALAPGWERDRTLDDLRARARAAFAAAHPDSAWVWKDPRACLVLPFWRPLTGGGEVAVIVVRNPLDVAWSLNRRNGFSVAFGLALWERYLRSLVRDASGLPALVLRYDDLLDDPIARCAAMGDFLREHGLPVTSPDPGAPGELLDPDLRHTRHSRDDLASDSRSSAEQVALLDALEGLVGEHGFLESPTLPPETWWVAPLVEARQAGNDDRREAAVTNAPDDGHGQDALRALDREEVRVGALERTLADRDAETAALHASIAAVESALGHTAIGRMERLALGAVRRVRAAQQRVRRR